MAAEGTWKVRVFEIYFALEVALFQKKFQTMKTLHFEVLVQDECLFCMVFFRFITGQFSPSFFPTRKMLLRNSSLAVSDLWIALFSSKFDVSWSTSIECCSDIFIAFGGFSWTGRFVNGIWYPFTIDKISWSRVTFSYCFTNCDSVPASGTFGLSSVNNFLTTGCMKVIDASGTSFELLVKGTLFRFSNEVLTLCCQTSMLKCPSVIMLKRNLEFTLFILVSIVWFALCHAVYFDFAKDLFEREISSRQLL